MDDNYDIAVKFAAALDGENYSLAKSLLSEQCSYSCRGKEHHGPDAIIGSYQEHGDAAQSFDAIKYESRVVADSPNTYRIHFADHITHHGQQFSFRSEQLLELNERGEITHIEHIDLPGELAALAEYRASLGWDVS